MGARVGEIIYYIVEAIIYCGFAYMLFVKPDIIMQRLFKKNTQKLTYLSYFLGVVAFGQVIQSINGIFHLY